MGALHTFVCQANSAMRILNVLYQSATSVTSPLLPEHSKKSRFVCRLQESMLMLFATS